MHKAMAVNAQTGREVKMERKDKKEYSCGGFGYSRPADAPCAYSYCHGEQYENKGSAPDHCPICGAPAVPQTEEA